MADMRWQCSYRKEVSALLVLIADFLLGREPKEFGHFLVLFEIFKEVAYDAHPCLIALGLEKYSIAYLAPEAAHPCTYDALR